MPSSSGPTTSWSGGARCGADVEPDAEHDGPLDRHLGEQPVDTATSLLLEGATTTDRDTVLRAVLRSLTQVLVEASPAGYRALCATVGSQVRVELPGGRVAQGLAEAVDDAGRLVVAGQAYSSGDVVHLRSAD